jgi:hypothetical protein
VIARPVLIIATMLLTLSGVATGQEAKPESDIHPAAFRAHVEFLGSDLLEGREAGTRGYELAAAYVAAQFKAYGLEPAGDGDSFFQPVPLRSARLEIDGAALTIIRHGRETELTFEDDFVPNADFSRTTSSTEAEAVFVGYGISAPAFGHDDYAGADVDGKIVVILASGPETLPTNARAHYSSGAEKAAAAAANGAVGVVVIFTPELAQRFPWERFVRSRQGTRMQWLDPQGEPHNSFPDLQFGAAVNFTGAAKLFASAPMSVEEAIEATKGSEPVGFDLGITLSAQVETRHEDIVSPNIVARLTGSDPTLADEYVAYTAHVDHIGISAPVDTDSINNGVFDNAAGVAALLEVARAFSERPEKPARSIVFIGTAAEEKGLLGADYFVHHPSVPIDRIVANIHMDGNIMAFPSKDFHALGSPHSSLGELVVDVAQEMDAEILPDPMPEQNFFVRSDQYPFVKKGVPALAIVNAFESTDPSIDGRQAVLDWIGTRYHRPSDDLSQPIHWDVGVAFTRLSYRTGVRIANEAARPTWNEGDFFGEQFGGR